jgi:hypothetical protein
MPSRSTVRLPLGNCFPSGIYATATGLRVGSRGKVQPAGPFFASIDKGCARRIRKACRKVGRTDLSSAILRLRGDR